MIWRRIIVPHDFCIAKPTKQFQCVLPFFWDLNHPSIRLFCGKAWQREIMPKDCAKSEGSITHLHMWLSKWLPPHSVNTGVKRDLNLPFKFLGLDTLCCEFYVLHTGLTKFVNYLWAATSHKSYKSSCNQVNFTRLQEWMWCHCIFYVTQGWNVHAILKSRRNGYIIKTTWQKCMRTCRNTLWPRIHSRSWISF